MNTAVNALLTLFCAAWLQIGASLPQTSVAADPCCWLCRIVCPVVGCDPDACQPACSTPAAAAPTATPACCGTPTAPPAPAPCCRGS